MFHIKGIFLVKGRLKGVNFSFLISLVFCRCSCPGVKTLSCLDVQGKPTPGQVFNPAVMPPQEVSGTCEPYSLLQYSHRSGKEWQFTRCFSIRQGADSFSKNGRSRHKVALVVLGSLASKPCRPTGRAGLKISLKDSLIVTYHWPKWSRADSRGKSEHSAPGPTLLFS